MYRMLCALVEERNRGLLGTNNADNPIQNEGDRRHWPGGPLNATDVARRRITDTGLGARPRVIS